MRFLATDATVSRSSRWQNESVMDGHSSTPLCREYSGPRNSRNSRLQTILNDHVKIGPVTGIDVFESARTLVKEV